MNTFELDVNKTGMKWSDNNKVTWKANPDANGTKLHFNKLAVKVKDINLLPVKTGVNGSTMDTFFASDALAVVEGKHGQIWTTSTDESRSILTSLLLLTLQASRSNRLARMQFLQA